MQDIDWHAVAQIAGTAITAGVALAGYLTGPGALRSRLKGDVELLTNLPTDSSAHEKLLEHIDHQIETIVKLDTEASRDTSGAVIASLMALGLGWLAFYLFGLDWRPWGWHHVWKWVWNALGVVMVVSAAACLSLMFDALQRVPRDIGGKPI